MCITINTETQGKDLWTVSMSNPPPIIVCADRAVLSGSDVVRF